MLASRITTPRPYSSLALAIKEKGWFWPSRVDYRAIMTIKDRSPVPTIDELLDQAHGSTPQAYFVESHIGFLFLCRSHEKNHED